MSAIVVWRRRLVGAVCPSRPWCATPRSRLGLAGAGSRRSRAATSSRQRRWRSAASKSCSMSWIDCAVAPRDRHRHDGPRLRDRHGASAQGPVSRAPRGRHRWAESRPRPRSRSSRSSSTSALDGAIVATLPSGVVSWHDSSAHCSRLGDAELALGLQLFEQHEALGAFDAVLAAAAKLAGRTLSSAPTAPSGPRPGSSIWSRAIRRWLASSPVRPRPTRLEPKARVTRSSRWSSTPRMVRW